MCKFDGQGSSFCLSIGAAVQDMFGESTGRSTDAANEVFIAQLLSEQKKVCEDSYHASFRTIKPADVLCNLHANASENLTVRVSILLTNQQRREICRLQGKGREL